MHSEKTSIIFDPLLTGSLSQQVQALLEKRQHDQARELCQSYLVQHPLSGAELILPRFEAIANVFFLSSLIKQNSLVIDWALGTLKTEIEQISTQYSHSTEQAEFYQRLLLLSEIMGRMRHWSSLKSISRLILKVVIDTSVTSQRIRIRALNNLGSALLGEQRIEDGVHVWECTIKDYDPKSADDCAAPLSSVHHNLAEVRSLQCQFQDARDHHIRSLELRLHCFPNDNLLVRQSRYNLALTLIECHDYQAAAAQIEQYLDSFTEENKYSPEAVKGQVLQSRVLIELGRYLTAESLINQLARMFSRSQELPGRLLVEIQLQRLDLAIRLGRENVIRSVTNRLPELLRDNNLEHSIHEARWHTLLGRIPQQIDLSPLENDREVHFNKALQIYRKRVVRHHPLLARTILDKSNLFLCTQRHQRATQTANSALSIYERTFREESLPLAYALIQMAKLVSSQQQFKLAKSLARKSLHIIRSNQQAPPVDLLTLYSTLSLIYQSTKNPRLAAYFSDAAAQVITQSLEFPPAMEEPFVEQAIALAHSVGHTHRLPQLLERKIHLLIEEHHADHPQVAEVQETLARTYGQLRQYEHAADCLEQCLPIRCTELGGEESSEAHELMQFAISIYQQAGRNDQAQELEQKFQQQSDKASHVLSDLF